MSAELGAPARSNSTETTVPGAPASACWILHKGVGRVGRPSTEVTMSPRSTPASAAGLPDATETT